MIFSPTNIANNIRISTRLCKVGGTLTSRLLLFFLWWWWGIKKRVGVHSAKMVKVVVTAYNKQAICFLQGLSDLVTLKSVFVDREYDVDTTYPPKNILDLGSHIGLSVIFFQLKYPQSFVYAFEPSWAVQRQLRENVGQFGSHVITHQEAVSDTNGTAMFYMSEKWPTSSSLINRGNNIKTTVVQTRTLDAIIDDLNLDHVDLIKFDIEGQEYGVFKSFHKLDRVSHIIGEAHYDLMSFSANDFQAIFRHFDWREVFHGDGNKRSIVVMNNKNLTRR